TMSGDGQITARIPVPDSTGGSNARLGVEIRNDLTSGSTFAGMIIDGTNSYWCQRRNTTGGASVRNPLGSGTAPNIWVRVVRSGNNFSGYESADGQNWTLVRSATNVTMGANVYVGLVVASGSTTTLNSTVFDNVTVVP